ncbi:hypothetical protein FB45DRAFT_214519 [Roridomyces roridus]|uniref:Uncharacterized protein n=1 Tax=Roridomyces roridus TaxID=1738132 RepID=A0AAD7BD10_9AGAR|nr:hypothetical protein FB45DRAFT_214519 [Roridomyces roridus]
MFLCMFHLIWGPPLLIFHRLVVTDRPIPGLATFDLFVVLWEIGVIGGLALPMVVDFTKAAESLDYENNWLWSTQVLVITAISLLTSSAILRVATMIKSPTKFYRQPFALLGGCHKTSPEYTPMRMLLNRSLARPLVSGESRFIVFGRVIILCCITLLVPAAGVYYVVFLPLHTQVYIRELVQVPNEIDRWGFIILMVRREFLLPRCYELRPAGQLYSESLSVQQFVPG